MITTVGIEADMNDIMTKNVYVTLSRYYTPAGKTYRKVARIGDYHVAFSTRNKLKLGK